MTLRYLATATLFAAAMLQACGGGGSDSSTPAPTVAPIASFPLLVGYKARITAGATDNYTVSGTCAGNAVITTSAATPATFEGINGFSATQTATTNFTNCTPASAAVSGISYFDTNLSLLGSSTPGVDYSKYAAAPPSLPASVKVGDTAIFSTLTVYANSTKATVTGQRILSYVIESDSTTTAIANLITKSYNTSGQLLFTQQSRYRVAADGSLAVMSIDVQYSTTSSNRLVFTKA